MKRFLQTNRPQLIILAGFVFAYLMVTITTNFAISLKALEFAFITIAFGFAPAYYFRCVFKYKDLIGWFLNAGTLGVLFIPFLFLFFGWLRLNFVFEFSILFLYLCAILGIVSLFFVDGNHIKSYLVFRDIDPIDGVVSIVFIAFTFLLTLRNFHFINIHWDAFTYWGLDAKYIFDNNQLRDLSFQSNLISFRYTSFHPIFHSIIYDLYDRVLEQFASWVNVYINFLAMFLIYWTIREKNSIQKILQSAGVLITSYSAISIVYMLSMHADVLSSFMVLVYFLILNNDVDLKPNMYWQRVLLLLLVSTSFYFIKSPFLYFTLIMIGLYVFYDLKYIIHKRSSLLHAKTALFVVVIVAILFLMRYSYFANLGESSSMGKDLSSFNPNVQVVSIRSLLAYLVDISSYLIRETPYILGLWWLTLFSIFFTKTVNKEYLYSYLSSLGFFLLPIAVYIAVQRSFQSESLPRYSAIGMYLFPLVLSYIDIVETKYRKIAAISVFSIIVGFVFLNVMWPMPIVERFKLSKGAYESELSKYSRYADDVIEQTGKDARILIVDDSAGKWLSNRNLPALFIRYYMMYNSVGGLYSISVRNLVNLSKTSSVDYILLLSYANSFEGCDQFLFADRDYLIEIGNDDFATGPDECIFEYFEVIDLGEAVR